MTDKPSKRRKWFQFRLRTLFIAILVLSLPLSWFAAKLQRVRIQQIAVRNIQNAGGKVVYDWQVRTPKTPHVPGWFHDIVGSDFHAEVRTVDFNYYPKPSTVCDGDLEILKRLPKVSSLYLMDAQITDDGLHSVSGLRELMILDLSGTSITDRGLSHLAGLSRLSILNLVGTNVTDDGVAKLKDALPRCTIVSKSVPLRLSNLPSAEER